MNITEDLHVDDSVSIGTRQTNSQLKLEVTSLLPQGGPNLSPVVGITTPNAGDFLALSCANSTDQSAQISWKQGSLCMGTNAGFDRTTFSEHLRITETGSLGIGTASPAERLHINGSVRGNQNGALRISTGSGHVDIGPQGPDSADFRTDRPRYYFDKELRIAGGMIGSQDEDLKLCTVGSTRLTIRNDTGKVGIGTENPLEQLHVAGNIRMAGRDLLMNESSRTLSVESGGSQNNYLVINAFGDHPGVKINQNTPRPFDVNDGSMYVAANSRVGLGITSPSRRLEVNREGNHTEFSLNERLFLDGEGTTVRLTNNAYRDNGTWAIKNSGKKAFTLELRDSGVFELYGTKTNGQADWLKLATFDAPNDRVVFPSGNLGIGIATPAKKLDVAGDIQASGIVRAADGFRPSTNDWEIARDGEDLVIREPEQNKEWARFKDDRSCHLSGTPDLWVNGKIGVGTTDPKQNLSIQAARPRLVLTDNQGDAGVLEFHEGEKELRIQHWDNFGARYRRTMMVLETSSGNVGIGTSAPAARLHVAGEVIANGKWLKGRGAGNEQAYIGGDGWGQDVQVGSLNKDVQNIGMYNWTSGQYMNVYARSYHRASDRRLKKNVKKISGATDALLQLRGVTFDWKDKQLQKLEGRQIGLVAQEVKEIIPEAVREGRNGVYSISYDSLVPLLIEALKEQHKRIATLEKKS